MNRTLLLTLVALMALSAPLAVHAADTTRPSRKPADRKDRAKAGLANLTTEVLKERLAREGWSMMGKGNLHSGFFIVPISKGSSLSGAAVLGSGLDKLVVDTFIQAITNNPGAACETDGTNVLCMLIPNDSATAQALVDVIQKR